MKKRKRTHIQRSEQVILIALLLMGILGGTTYFFTKQTVKTADRIEQTQNNIVRSGESVAESKSEPEIVTTQASIIAVGDNLMHMPVVNGGLLEDGTYNYVSYFDPLRTEIESADIAVINQETILGGAEFEYSGYPTFNSPQEMGDALATVGFDVVLQATNHSMDKGSDGIRSAMSFWQTKHPDMITLGLNESVEEQSEIAMIERNGISFALLNYTYGLNGIELPSDKLYLVNLLDETMVAEHIEKAKNMADCVIVFPHWGTEYMTEPDSYQLEWNDFFAEHGVDIVIGSHPHVVQPVEWVDRPDGKKMLVYYSLGNFISRQKDAYNMLGGMAKITVEKTGDDIEVTHGGITPLVTHYESEGQWNFAVYKLSEYTQSQVETHGIQAHDERFTLDYLNELAQRILGEYIE